MNNFTQFTSSNDHGNRWFIFKEDKLLLKNNEIPEAKTPPLPVKEGTMLHCIPGEHGNNDCAYETDAIVTENWQEVGLRASYNILSNDLYCVAGCAFERIFWDRTTHFCSVCGSETKPAGRIMKLCTKCGREIFPAVSPAIIVLVRRGDSALLVRAHNFRGSFHGLVAGFVEPGENLEDCVAREVMEETGITVGNIRYFASQPWPYPCGIMIGFNADYVSGDIHLQKEELSSGNFFRKEALPELPAKLSLARKLIDAWLDEK